MRKTVLEIIGNTPLVSLKNIENYFYLNVHVFAKLEYFNPFGSIKDRAAFQIINDAKISPKDRIIEATSGNMGIALSAISKIKGHKATIIMPENASEARKKIIASYGADLILTDAESGMTGAIEKAKEILSIEPNIYYANQFNNPSSVKAHYLKTAPEIYRQTEKDVDVIICGIGSGGTIMGISSYSKKYSPRTEIIGVLPTNFPHKIQGIGAGFVPKILDTNAIDKIIYVNDEEAFFHQQILLNKEGIMAGISSGAVLAAAIVQLRSKQYIDKKVVLIFPDSGERYI